MGVSWSDAAPQIIQGLLIIKLIDIIININNDLPAWQPNIADTGLKL